MDIKICGITTIEAAQIAVDAGATMIGFVFAPSTRKISVSRAKEISASLPVSIEKVGVFVNESVSRIQSIGEKVGLTMVQLHGEESASDMQKIPYPIIKAVSIDQIDKMNSDWLLPNYYLVDSPPAQFKGGTGIPFDWRRLESTTQLPPFMLAGGLTSENVHKAITHTKCIGVDVSSGVETNGQKDHAKIKAFIHEAKRAKGEIKVTYTQIPDQRGKFGIFGGKFIPELLIPALQELEQAYEEAIIDPAFTKEMEEYLVDYVGRTTPLYYAKRLTEACKGAHIYLKREDLNHTGAHKINNALGQALLAKRMGKTKIVAETGAGQHGVATATACALLGLECTVFMGEVDIKRQQQNVFRMELLGATIVSVKNGSGTLKDAVNEALRFWVKHVEHVHYILGSVVGPHPFPKIVRDFQSVIGKETRKQFMQKTGTLPDAVVACVGGGSNAIGMFHSFIQDEHVKLYGVEAAGSGIETGKHSAAISAGTPGILHGTLTYLLQDEHGQIEETSSISAGLDYPGIGPEHSYLKSIDRISYPSIRDKEALEAFHLLAKTEGILPALESAHAIAYAKIIAQKMSQDEHIIICLSGRGDKDVPQIQTMIGSDML